MKENKHLMKATIVVVVCAILMMPVVYINDLVQERKSRKQEITAEISKNWSKAQTIGSPYISVSNAAAGGNKNNILQATTTNQQEITLTPKPFKRSIYEITVYEAAVTQTGTMSKDELAKLAALSSTPEMKLNFPITDIKGIVDSVVLTINNVNYIMSVAAGLSTDTYKILTANLPALDYSADLNYKINLKLRGTEAITSLPLAGNNKITIKSSWKDPSFFGNHMTDKKEISNNGFSATWQISKYQTGIVQLQENLQNTSDQLVGVNLINPVDTYTKTMRSAKYAVLFIALTFAIFFFIEALKNKEVHPIAYGLVGLALVLFFTLLLSIGEHTGFNIAYVIAATATIALISWYTKLVLQTVANTVTVALSLVGIYSFVFFIIQMEEKSLLVGSIGLFIILALLMRLSSKINWNANNKKLPTPQNV